MSTTLRTDYGHARAPDLCTHAVSYRLTCEEYEVIAGRLRYQAVHAAPAPEPPSPCLSDLLTEGGPYPAGGAR